MKTLEDHVILYDQVCPMCTIYTKGFVKAGMLDADGRTTYQTMHGDTETSSAQVLKKLVDCKRAVNEIALVNKKTGAVYYGVQSLFLILETSFPILKPVFRCKPFAWVADKAYKVVSFNRRVIIPSRTGQEKGEHQPAFKRTYRLFYLLATWIATAFILSKYNNNMVALIPAGTLYREFAVCGGQIIWQGLIISVLDKNRFWDYLGNMMTISFEGSLLLLPGMGVLKSLSVTDASVYALWFMAVAGLMFLEHIRRTNLLKLSGWLTASWVLYRIILLVVIL